MRSNGKTAEENFRTAEVERLKIEWLAVKVYIKNEQHAINGDVAKENILNGWITSTVSGFANFACRLHTF